MNIAIIQTGIANVASVLVAFERLKTNPRIVRTPNEIDERDAVVLPGVGSFAAGLTNLRQNGWTDLLCSRIEEDRPLLAICLGLQMLCRSSDEAPGVPGLGVLPVTVDNLPDSVALPHFGWNSITSDSAAIPKGFVYYANSFGITNYKPLINASWDVATTEYGTRFVAAVQRNSILACQFHPELSGAFGSKIIERWLKMSQRRLGREEGVSC